MVGRRMARQGTEYGKVEQAAQAVIFQTPVVCFIIYFMLGLSCFVGPEGQFLKGACCGRPTLVFSSGSHRLWVL